MRYFSRGRHRRTKRSQSVWNLIDNARRFPIDDMFAIVALEWEHRGEYRPPREPDSAVEYAGQLAHRRVNRLVGNR